MTLGMKSVIAAVTAVLFALPAHAEAPAYERVLSAATLYITGDGDYDLAVLVDNLSDGADLYIYPGIERAKLDAPVKPALVKKNAAWTGALAGTRPFVEVSEKGSLLIKSGNEAIGRGRWSQTLTVVYRDKDFLVAGVTREDRDTLDLKAGGACELNLLTGKGKRNGKPIETKFRPVRLADWSDEKLPKECVFPVN